MVFSMVLYGIKLFGMKASIVLSLTISKGPPEMHSSSDSDHLQSPLHRCLAMAGWGAPGAPGGGGGGDSSHPYAFPE